MPFLEVERREDMFDVRYGIMRLASLFAIYYGLTEFLKEPQNMDILMTGSGEIWNEVFEWGQNKFMGVENNSTAVQMKKSARQIYAEAFMDDDKFGMSGKRFYDETDFSKPPEAPIAEESEPVILEVEPAPVNLEDAEDELDRLTNNEELWLY